MVDALTRIEADYLIETAYDPRRAVEAMAGEQSSGTFIAVPGETGELKARAGARVERLEVVGAVDEAGLPGSGTVDGIRVRATVTLSWPMGNIGPSLPNLMATVAGNLFELKQFSGVRLVDLRLPSAFAQSYHGPRFGVAGTRRLSGVHNRPLIGTIIKPSVGLSPSQTAELVQQLCEADVDFIKDDELQSDGSTCPFDERVAAVMDVVNRQADLTGKKVMFAFNLTGDLDQMRRRHDLVVASAGTCVMASLNSVGLVGMIELGRHTQLPIHAHRNGWGYLSRHPMLGFSYVAWHKVWRLAGADHMHVNGLANKFCEDDDEVIRSAQACLAPLFSDRPDTVMPVFSSGQTVHQVHDTFSALGSVDLIHAAGGGIMAHPHGPGGGVRALRDAWDAALAGVPLVEAAASRPALAAALTSGP